MTNLLDYDWSTTPCAKCGAVGHLRLEVRSTLVAKPLGTWSLAGVQCKTVASEQPWPWLVCDACGRECAGEPA